MTTNIVPTYYTLIKVIMWNSNTNTIKIKIYIHVLIYLYNKKFKNWQITILVKLYSNGTHGGDQNELSIFYYSVFHIKIIILFLLNRFLHNYYANIYNICKY